MVARKKCNFRTGAVLDFSILELTCELTLTNNTSHPHRTFPEIPDFLDFELRSLERSQESGISGFLHRISPDWTVIALKMSQKHVFFSICVKVARLHPHVSRIAGLSNEASIC